jgi:putative hydrolase of the HAD superfamily
MTRAVLFDVGGPIDTEVEYERLIDAHIIEALAAEGVAVSSQAYADANAWAVEAFAPNAYAAIVWRLAGGDRGVAARAFGAVSARSDERHRLRGGIELRPGVDTLVRRLHARGVPLGLAANQPARVIADLERFGLGDCFTARAVSGTHGYRKPDARLFLRACDDLGVSPQECVMVGDRVDNDIAPAAALGMRTVLLRTGRHARQQPRSADEVPDDDVTDLDGVEAALDALLGG